MGLPSLKDVSTASFEVARSARSCGSKMRILSAETGSDERPSGMSCDDPRNVDDHCTAAFSCWMNKAADTVVCSTSYTGSVAGNQPSIRSCC